MRGWLVSLMFVSGLAYASPTMYTFLSKGQNYSPLDVMQVLEKDYPKMIITEFELDVKNSQVRYEFDMIDLDDNTTTEFYMSAETGRILEQKVEKLEADDYEEVTAAKILRKKQMKFSELVTLALKDGTSFAYLTDAQLDHDLGISYLELEVVNEQHRTKLAFDIQNLRPLPMLKWN